MGNEFGADVAAIVGLANTMGLGLVGSGWPPLTQPTTFNELDINMSPGLGMLRFVSLPNPAS